MHGQSNQSVSFLCMDRSWTGGASRLAVSRTQYASTRTTENEESDVNTGTFLLKVEEERCANGGPKLFHRSGFSSRSPSGSGHHTSFLAFSPSFLSK